MAVSGDTLAAGTYLHSNHHGPPGAAYVFRRSDDIWTEHGKLATPLSSHGGIFGFSVALQGSRLLVGAPGEVSGDDNIGSGAVYVYSSDGEGWTEDGKITPPEGPSKNFFGDALALSGDAIVVGASLDKANGTEAGAAYAFTAIKDSKPSLPPVSKVEPARDVEWTKSFPVDGNGGDDITTIPADPAQEAPMVEEADFWVGGGGGCTYGRQLFPFHTPSLNLLPVAAIAVARLRRRRRALQAGRS